MMGSQWFYYDLPMWHDPLLYHCKNHRKNLFILHQAADISFFHVNPVSTLFYHSFSKNNLFLLPHTTHFYFFYMFLCVGI